MEAQVTAKIIDLQERAADKQMERVLYLTNLSPDEAALIADRTLSKYVDDKSVEDFKRVLDEVETKPESAGERIEEMARLLGQSELDK